MKKIIVVLALSLLWLSRVQAEPSSESIIQMADRARGGDLPGIEWTVKVEVVDQNGPNDNAGRLIQVSANDSAWNAEFIDPPKIKGQRLVQKGKNMWFMSPNLQKPVPISQRQRLTGGAANGDIAATNYERDYTAVRLPDETLDGVLCYVFDLSARDKSVTYDKIRYWVAKATNLGLKADFKSLSGKLLKTAWFKYDNLIAYQDKEIPFVSVMSIEDKLNDDEKTILIYSNITVKTIPAIKFQL